MFRLFNAETYKKVDRTNKDLLDDYISELRLNGKKKGTIEQYTYDIKAFYCYCHDEFGNKCIMDVTRREFKRFFLDMKDAGCSNARINRFESSLRNLLEYVSDEYEREYPVNIMSKIKNLKKEEVRDIIFLTEEQVQFVINMLVERKEYQKALLVSLSYESAGRRNEILQVTKESLLDRTTNSTNQVIGKRGKKFILRYYKQTEELFDLYMEQRGEDDCEALFVIKNKKGEVRPADYSTLYGWTVWTRHLYAQLTGEDIKWNNHSYRHSCLENLINGSHHILAELGKECLTVTEARLLAHHEDEKTTRGYIMNIDEKEEEDLFAT